MSPFECVLGSNPLLPVSLIKLSMQEEAHKGAKEHADNLLRIHAQVKENIIKANSRYKSKADKGKQDKRSFKEGYWVWVYLRKDKFPKKRPSKLMPRASGPYQIKAKIGDNAYQVEIGEAIGIHSTFNIGDLTPYQGSSKLRTILFKEGGLKHPAPQNKSQTLSQTLLLSSQGVQLETFQHQVQDQLFKGSIIIK